MCVAADHFFPGAFHSGQVLQKDLALRSRQHLTYSITIIHRHIPQGVRGPHNLEPTSPQLHSDFTPGWCRSFGQVSLVSRADSHLHSARQSSIIFMLLNQSSCRWDPTWRDPSNTLCLGLRLPPGQRVNTVGWSHDYSVGQDDHYCWSVGAKSLRSM